MDQGRTGLAWGAAYAGRAARRRLPQRGASLTHVSAAALAVFSATVPLPAASATGLRVNADRVPCAERHQIALKVQQLLQGTPELEGIDRLVVTFEVASPDVLLLRLSEGRRALDRPLFFSPSDCADLAQTAAALVRGWLRESWDALARATAIREDEFSSPSRPHSSTPQPLSGEAEEDALARNEDGFGTSRSSWRLLAFAGLHAAPGSPVQGPAPTAAAGVDWNFPWPRLGLSARAGIDLPIRQSMGSGHLSAYVWHLAALARTRLAGFGPSQLDLLAGAALTVIQAESTSFVVNRSKTVPRPAATVMVQWRRQLGPRLALAVAAGVTSRLRAERFHIANVSETFAVPPLRCQAAAGLAFDLE